MRLGDWDWKRWALLMAAFWLAVALLDLSRFLIFPEYRLEWASLAAWRVPAWMLWVLFTPAILWSGRRFQVGRRNWLRRLGLHAAGALGFAIVHILASATLLHYFGPSPPDQPMSFLSALVMIALFEGQLVALLYFAILGLQHGIRYYRESQRRALEASRLEGQLAQAQLRNLKMQLHPHFLFNSLNAVATLVRRGDSSDAVRILAGLGDLLREALEQGGTQMVALEEELRFLKKYLDIEQIRFQDRLRVDFDVPRDLRGARVPTLILQPLVENALRHGVSKRRRAGRIKVSGRRRDGRLCLEVRDDGPGLPSGAPQEGLGIANTRARLRQLFGEEGALELQSPPDGGTRARIRMPFTDQEGAQPSD